MMQISGFKRKYGYALCCFIAGMVSMANAEPTTPNSALDADTPVEPALQTVIIEGSRTSQIGKADSANAGIVTQKQLAARAVYRPAELLETAPGLIVSQHSGEGKANQFYLRGFNLDHGTDLRTSVDGMLVNQRSHSHGQGWSDLNFLIPELANRLEYQKGAFDASMGDFAAAGAVNVQYQNKLDQGIASLGVGQNGFRRLLLADSPMLGAGHLLYALEAFKNDGPFVQGDDFRKLNGVLRYHQGNAAQGLTLSAMAYQAHWHATDQIPVRALASGLLSNRFAAIDQTDGGNARRTSLGLEWHRNQDGVATKLQASIIHAKLDLYSNFSYFLNDPINGDQFSQPDQRVTSALDWSQRRSVNWLGQDASIRYGAQFQNDNIFNGLHNTRARQRLTTIRSDHIVETSLGLYLDHQTTWSPHLRTVLGAREDWYRFKVASNHEVNSGNEQASIGSLKFNLIAGPWAKTEFYLNAGSGFHSNDARGTTIRQDPQTGDNVERGAALARSRALELGVRNEWLPGLNTTFSLYRLDFASELVFVGDAGSTEAGRPSRRVGFEWSNYYQPLAWLTLDADLAYTRARYRDLQASGQHITGAVEGVASLAVAVDNLGPWFGALQWRYFGPRPLTEDNSVRSQATGTLNGRIGYKLSPRIKLALEGYNLSNRRDSAIDYYYPSRLPGEAASGVEDVHFHPVESRSWRLTLQTEF